MLASEEHCPCDAAGVLALEEQRFGFAVYEAEDLAVTTDVELALLLMKICQPGFILTLLLCSLFSC